VWGRCDKKSKYVYYE